MFQNFLSAASPHQAHHRVAALRHLLTQHHLDGVIVPLSDEYQNEYIPEDAARLSWLTGFTGSAGAAVILQQQAFLFTDGRYTIQIRQETDGSIFSYYNVQETSLTQFLSQYAAPLRLGFDPMLHPVLEVEKLEHAIKKNGGELIATPENLVDKIWLDRPAPKNAAIFLQPIQFAGCSAQEKIQHVQAQLQQQQIATFILTDPSCIAWLFNIRGSDVVHNPLPLCFCLMRAEHPPKIFIHPKKLTEATQRYLGQQADVLHPEEFLQQIALFAQTEEVIALDASKTPYKIAQIIKKQGEGYQLMADPITRLKAIKNSVECEGARRAQHRDNLAMIRFLAWLQQQQPHSISEICAAKKLEDIRQQTAKELGFELKEISFDTIAGSGGNSAIIHYRVSEKTNRQLQKGEVFLIDSGAQYADGTTDITRTIAIGEVCEEIKHCFTLVLKGMIALSKAYFPERSCGAQLDILARQFLLKEKMNYPHGTGHGVGSYLCVHEGPQNISPLGHEALQEGMIISNEPGFYKEGAFGIRIENLLLVQKVPQQQGQEKLPLLCFETLTYCPIDRHLILVSLLTTEELDWLNQYHAKIYSDFNSLLNEEEKLWLRQATAPLGKK